jgi:hypothetical protein
MLWLVHILDVLINIHQEVLISLNKHLQHGLQTNLESSNSLYFYLAPNSLVLLSSTEQTSSVSSHHCRISMVLMRKMDAIICNTHLKGSRSSSMCQSSTLVYTVHCVLYPHVTLSHLIAYLGWIYDRSTQLSQYYNLLLPFVSTVSWKAAHSTILLFISTVNSIWTR